ncbi:MAG: DEAD/DEAH box helicase [Anaerolineales bacterium]
MNLRRLDYQENTLAALQRFLDEAQFGDAPGAFARTATPRKNGLPRYQPLPGLESVPYVCLRLPTGGGKTLLAARSVGLAARRYLSKDYPLTLWLVPTNTIRQQTLATLKDPRHPNRQALEAAFGGRVRAFDIDEFEQIRPHDLSSSACVIVGTLATPRVSKTDIRKVYAHNENLEPHFAINLTGLGDRSGLERDEAGQLKYSFINLLALHRPLVIVDEAHNAASDLSFEVLQRLRPACVIEFTATPAPNSNILHSVSATELKNEWMIKLPIRLTEYAAWQEAVRDSLVRRDQLHELARAEPDFIHPIVLIQAESKDREVTVEVVEKFLTETENIPRERIAIATGAQRELDGVNLLDPQNKVNIVITVEALKEGWDCPFAYVFCSVASVHSKRDVEQLLGRVLRMPYARPRQHPELNRAYACVSKTSWTHAVNQLCDRLVSMGFEEAEAQESVSPQPPLFPTAPQTAEAAPALTYRLSAAPDFSGLSLFEQSAVYTTSTNDGGVIVSVRGELTPELEAKLLAAAPKKDRVGLETTIAVHRRAPRPLSPAERGETFAVPQLCFRFEGELELAEPDALLDLLGWDILNYPAELTPGEFDVRETADTFEIDLNGQHLAIRHVEQATLELNLAPTAWTDTELIRRLDPHLRQPDLAQPKLLEFLRRMIRYLITQRQLPLTALVRFRYPLQKALEVKIKSLRDQAKAGAYQAYLFAPTAQVETSFEYAFNFPPVYPAREFFSGRYQFSDKHFYARVGEFDNDEEFDCAQAIDRNRDINRWVRNVPVSGMFRLPLANGFFYPDFVAELRDGRLLVVEYKGAHLIEHEAPKRVVGELWETQSHGQALFLWAVAQGQDPQRRDVYRQLEDKISARSSR